MASGSILGGGGGGRPGGRGRSAAAGMRFFVNVPDNGAAPAARAAQATAGNSKAAKRRAKTQKLRRSPGSLLGFAASQFANFAGDVYNDTVNKNQ